MSDGQRSLFHIALTAATLEVERDARQQCIEESSFEQEKLRAAHLTILAIEEPENSLAPFFLARILDQLREIGTFPSAQVVLSSHSPAILSRVHPEEIRFLRLDRGRRRSYVVPITLPAHDEAASQYVRLAVKAYPELYFARFVILAEGDSERLVIPRIAEAMGVPLDPSFVPVVPLGGRFVRHFWRLLSDLGIPFATLLDLDLGRSHGGAGSIKRIFEEHEDVGCDPMELADVQAGLIDIDALDDLSDEDVTPDKNHENVWVNALEKIGVFFSVPLDLDFAMLKAFPNAYRQVRSGGTGPRTDPKSVESKKKQVLKSDGRPELYDDSYDEEFAWYPYLFQSRSKPETHLAALARLSGEELRKEAPGALRKLVTAVGSALDPGASKKN